MMSRSMAVRMGLEAALDLLLRGVAAVAVWLLVLSCCDVVVLPLADGCGGLS